MKWSLPRKLVGRTKRLKEGKWRPNDFTSKLRVPVTCPKAFFLQIVFVLRIKRIPIRDNKVQRRVRFADSVVHAATSRKEGELTCWEKHLWLQFWWSVIKRSINRMNRRKEFWKKRKFDVIGVIVVRWQSKKYDWDMWGNYEILQYSLLGANDISSRALFIYS